jgi:processing peptidase subunit alpha
VFQAAYRQNTLGLPKICPPDYISSINRGQLYTYLKNLHTPDRMVVAGVGVEHNRLVEAVRKEFLGRTPIWNELPGIIDVSKSLDRSVAQYTGGMLKVIL